MRPLTAMSSYHVRYWWERLVRFSHVTVRFLVVCQGFGRASSARTLSRIVVIGQKQYGVTYRQGERPWMGHENTHWSGEEQYNGTPLIRKVAALQVRLSCAQPSARRAGTGVQTLQLCGTTVLSICKEIAGRWEPADRSK